MESMKKKYTFLLSILSVFLLLTCNEQEESIKSSDTEPMSSHLPFLEEGKTWVYNAHPIYMYPDYEYKYVVKGDTVINGVKGNKIYTYNFDNDGAWEYVTSLYEDEGKVWRLEDATQILLYDFSVEQGGRIEVNGGVSLWAYSVFKLFCYGVHRRCLWVINCPVERVTSPTDERYLYSFVLWVEGVGSVEDFLRNYDSNTPTDSKSHRLIRVEERGCEVFNMEEFKKNFFVEEGDVGYMIIPGSEKN